MLWTLVTLLIAGLGVCNSRYMGLALGANQENQTIQTEYFVASGVENRGATADIAINWSENNGSAAEFAVHANEIERETKLQERVQGTDTTPSQLPLSLDRFSENAVTGILDFSAPLNEKEKSALGATNSDVNGNIPVTVTNLASLASTQDEKENVDRVLGDITASSKSSGSKSNDYEKAENREEPKLTFIDSGDTTIAQDESKIRHPTDTSNINFETTVIYYQNRDEIKDKEERSQPAPKNTKNSNRDHTTVTSDFIFPVQDSFNEVQPTIQVNKRADASSVTNETLQDHELLPESTKLDLDQQSPVIDSQFEKPEPLSGNHSTILETLGYESVEFQEPNGHPSYNETRSNELDPIKEQAKDTKFEVVEERIEGVKSTPSTREYFDLETQTIMSRTEATKSNTEEGVEELLENATKSVADTENYNDKIRQAETNNQALLLDSIKQDSFVELNHELVTANVASSDNIEQQQVSAETITLVPIQVTASKSLETEDSANSVSNGPDPMDIYKENLLESIRLSDPEEMMKAEEKAFDAAIKQLIEQGIDSFNQQKSVEAVPTPTTKKQVAQDKEEKLSQKKSGETSEEQQQVSTETITLVPIQVTASKSLETEDSANSVSNGPDPMDIYKENLLESIRLSDPEEMMKAEEKAFDAAIKQLIEQGIDSFNQQKSVEAVPTPTTKKQVAQDKEEKLSQKKSGETSEEQQQVSTETITLVPIQVTASKSLETEDSANSVSNGPDPMDIYKENLLESIRLSDPEEMMKAEEKAFDAAIKQLIEQGIDSFNQQKSVEAVPTPTTKKQVAQDKEEKLSQKKSGETSEEQQQVSTETITLVPIQVTASKSLETEDSANSVSNGPDPMDIYKENLLESIRLSDPEEMMKAEEKAFDAAIKQLIEQGIDSFNQQESVEAVPTPTTKNQVAQDKEEKLSQKKSGETSEETNILKVNVSESKQDLPSQTYEGEFPVIRSGIDVGNHHSVEKQPYFEGAESEGTGVKIRKSNESEVVKSSLQANRVEPNLSNTSWSHFSDDSLNNFTKDLKSNKMQQTTGTVDQSIHTAFVPDVRKGLLKGITYSENQKKLSSVLELEASPNLAEKNSSKLANIRFTATSNENNEKHISNRSQLSISSVTTETESLEVKSFVGSLLPRNNESAFEPTSQSQPDVSRPRDVQPADDAIEDLIEQVIETLNAPKEVEELLEREIEESFNTAPKQEVSLIQEKEKSEESLEEGLNRESFSNADTNDILILNGIVDSASDIARLQSFVEYVPNDYYEEASNEKFERNREPSTSNMNSEEVSVEASFTRESQQKAAVEQIQVPSSEESEAYYNQGSKYEKQKIETISPELTNSEIISEEDIETIIKTDAFSNSSTVSKIEPGEIKLEVTHPPAESLADQVKTNGRLTQISEVEMNESERISTTVQGSGTQRDYSLYGEDLHKDTKGISNFNSKSNAGGVTSANNPEVTKHANEELDEEYSNERFELLMEERSSGFRNTISDLPDIVPSASINTVPKGLDNVEATHCESASENSHPDVSRQHIESPVAHATEVIEPDPKVKERFWPLSEIDETLYRKVSHRPTFHGRSMLSEELVVPQSLQVAANFIPTKVEFDSVDLETQQISSTAELARDTSKHSAEPPGRALDDQTDNREVSSTNFVEAVVEAAELTTEMNRFIWTFHSSMAPSEEVPLSGARTPATTIRSKLVESRSIVSRLEPYEQVAATNLTIIIALCVTVLFLLMVLLVFGIKVRNQHGTLNIELAEQQTNSYVTVPTRQDN